MLTGPTGCGKTRLVEHMGLLLRRPVVTISCHDDLTSSDLVGRFMVTGGDVVWTDGPLTRAVKAGAICYLDEVVEARHDSLAILHSLTDHRRALYLDRAGEVVEAPEAFMLVCSYNPAYRSSLKELKPSFRQRFVTLSMRYLPPEREAEVIVAEAGIALDVGAATRAVRHCDPDRGRGLPLRATVHPGPGHRGAAHCRRCNRIGGRRGLHPRAAVHRRGHHRRTTRSRGGQPGRRRQLEHVTLRKESRDMDQKETQAQEGTHRPADRHLRLSADDVRHPALHVLRPRVVGVVNLPLLTAFRATAATARTDSASKNTTTNPGWRSAGPTSG